MPTRQPLGLQGLFTGCPKACGHRCSQGMSSACSAHNSTLLSSDVDGCTPRGFPVRGWLLPLTEVTLRQTE